MSRVRLYVTCAFGFGFMIIGLVVGLVIRHQVRQGLTRLGSICGEDDKTYESWADNTKQDSAPKYKHYYAFNATNVGEYLAQSPDRRVDLDLNLIGPYSMRQYETKFNVSFNGDSSEVTFETFERYEFNKAVSCANCDNYDHVIGLNPALLKAMTAAGQEYLIALSASAVDANYALKGVKPCTPERIAYSLTHHGCNITGDPLCCCDSTPVFGQLNVTSDYLKCPVRAGGPTGIYSTFAGFDSGFKFNSPVFSAPVTSPLFLRKNLHEFAFGYPSALFGLLAGLKLRGDTTGQLAKMAEFTQHALEVCSFDVTKETAPKPEELPGKPYQYLGGISCAPIKGVFFWAQSPSPQVPLSRCAMLASGSVAAGCTCVNPKHGDAGISTATKPCCTTSGFGCLASVPGYVTDAYFVNKDHAYLHSAGPTTQNTGCNSKNGQEFWWSRYEGAPSTPVFSLRTYAGPNATLRKPYTSPSGDDLNFVGRDPKTNFEPSVGYTAPVQGGDGTRFRPTGKTSAAFNLQLSNGYPKDTEALVYITQVRRAATVYRTNEEMLDKILVNRFEPSTTLLDQNVPANPPNLNTSVVGAGTPFAGVQDVSYLSGFNAYVSRPLFLLGDESLLTQKPANCVGQQCVGISVTREGRRAVASSNHTTFLLVEPSTGLTLNAHKQLQASFALYNCGFSCREASMANLMAPYIPGGKIIPQYYMDETASATSKQLDKFRSVMSINIAADVIMLAFPLVGATLIGVSLVYWYRKGHRQSAHRETLLGSRS